MSKITNYTEAGQVAGRYAWYINNALRERIDTWTKQIAAARKTVEQSKIGGTAEYACRHIPHGEESYRSLEAMADNLEHQLQGYVQAWEALKAVGIE